MEGPFDDDRDGIPGQEKQDTSVVYDDIVSSSVTTMKQGMAPGAIMTPDGLELTWNPKEGAYSLCLDNTMSQFQTKVSCGSSSGSSSGRSSLKPYQDGHSQAIVVVIVVVVVVVVVVTIADPSLPIDDQVVDFTSKAVGLDEEQKPEIVVPSIPGGY